MVTPEKRDEQTGNELSRQRRDANAREEGAPAGRRAGRRRPGGGGRVRVGPETRLLQGHLSAQPPPRGCLTINKDSLPPVDFPAPRFLKTADTCGAELSLIRAEQKPLTEKRPKGPGRGRAGDRLLKQTIGT